MQTLGELQQTGGEVELGRRRERAQFFLGQIMAADLCKCRRALGGGVAKHDLGDVILNLGRRLVIDRHAKALACQEAVELSGIIGGDPEKMSCALGLEADGAGRPIGRTRALAIMGLFGFGKLGEMGRGRIDITRSPGAHPDGPVDVRHDVA